MRQQSTSSPVPFVSLSFDVITLGGFSLFMFLVLLLSTQFELGLLSPTKAIEITALLSWVINWPHFSATLWRLYGNAESLREFQLTAILSPIFVALGLGACFLHPELFAGLWVKLFLLWSGYHFSAQSLGIALIYLRRDQIQLNFFEQKIFSLFAFAPYFLAVLGGETAASAGPYFGVTIPTLHLPLWINSWTGPVMILVGLVFLLSLLSLKRREQRWPHFLIVIPLIAQFVWFWQARNIPAYIAFVPAFHSFQYLALAWYMDAYSNTEQKKSVWRGGLKWLSANVIGGIILFYILPRGVRWFLPANTFSANWIEGVTIASVQIHHFFVDGVIWKLKSPTIFKALTTKWYRSKAATMVGTVALLFLVSFTSFQVQAKDLPQSSYYVPELHLQQELEPIRVVFRTDFGDMQFVFYRKVAPQHVDRIIKAARAGEFAGVSFTRLVRGFVLQISELPISNQGDQYPPLNAEISNLPHVRGILSMARHDGNVNSARTSFSILLGNAPHLDGQYTIFGRLETGEDVLRKIEELINTESPLPKIPIVVRSSEVFRFPEERDIVNLKGPQEPIAMIQALAAPTKTPMRWLFVLALFLFLFSNILAYVVREPSKRGLRWSRFLHGFSLLILSFGVLGLGTAQNTGIEDSLFSGLALLGIWFSFRAISGLELSSK
jgi:cyclophilin family peptidyl-prolyl cis-trans isomerase